MGFFDTAPTPHWTAAFFSLIFAAMSKPAKASDAARVALPFEEALKKLETIVEAMESDDLPLESLLAQYEEGTRLVKLCQDKLGEAELKISQLEKNASGELALKPLVERMDSE